MCTTKNHDFYNWLAGFIDGEGSFGLYKNDYKKNWTGHFEASFTIKVRRDDSATIIKIRRTLGFGYIYYTRIKPAGNGNLQIIYKIQSIADALKLIDILDRHPLRAKKKADYKIWRQGVKIMNKYGIRDSRLVDIHLNLKRSKAYNGETIKQD